MLKYNIITAAVFGAIWTVLSMAMPQVFIKLFMTPTPRGAVNSSRNNQNLCDFIYTAAVQYLFNVLFPGYYESQDITYRIRCKRYCNKRCSDTLLPVAFGGNAVWWAMPITEAVVFVYSAVMMKKVKLSR